jgi:hypothetical protein
MGHGFKIALQTVNPIAIAVIEAKQSPVAGLKNRIQRHGEKALRFGSF